MVVKCRHCGKRFLRLNQHLSLSRICASLEISRPSTTPPTITSKKPTTVPPTSAITANATSTSTTSNLSAPPAATTITEVASVGILLVRGHHQEPVQENITFCSNINQQERISTSFEDNGEEGDEDSLDSTSTTTSTIPLIAAAGVQRDFDASTINQNNEEEPSNNRIGKITGLGHMSPEHSLRLRLAMLFHQQRWPVTSSLIDDIIKIFRDETLHNQLDITNVQGTQQTFMKHLRKKTNSPSPPKTTIVPIESSEYNLHDLNPSRNFRNHVSVVTWNVKEQILSLLSNRQLFGSIDNLVVDAEDPFAMYNPPDNRYGEVLSGDLYRRTYQKLQASHKSDYSDGITTCKEFYVLPIALYLDKTGTTAMERFGLEPVMITLLNLKESIRNKTSQAWTPLGFMPDLDNKSKNATKQVGQGKLLNKRWQKGMSCRNYHRCLEQILNGLAELQRTGFITTLHFGSVRKRCHVYLPLFCILGDIKSQDTLTGRIVNHQRTMKRIYWQCKCPFRCLADPKATCELIQHGEVMGLLEGSEDITVVNMETQTIVMGAPDPTILQRFFYTRTAEQQSDTMSVNDTLDSRSTTSAQLLHEEDTRMMDCTTVQLQPTSLIDNPIMTEDEFEEYMDRLNDLSLNRVDSILNYVYYGDSTTAQYGACCIDTMHSFEGGVIKTMCGVFVKNMSTVCKGWLNNSIDRMLVDCRSSERKNFPRMNFSKGATNITLLTCREWVGLLLAFLTSSVSYSGEPILDHFLKKGYDQRKKDIEEEELETVKKRKSSEHEETGSLIVLEEESCDDSQRSQHERDDSSDDESRDDVSARVSCTVQPKQVTRREFVDMVENILMLYSFLKRDVFWERDDIDGQAKMSKLLNDMLGKLVENMPRKGGNGWNLAKVHAIFKMIPSHISERGGTKHTDTNVGERGLSFWAKKTGRNTNRQSRDKVTFQTAQNLDDYLVVARASTMFGLLDITETDESSSDDQTVSTDTDANTENHITKKIQHGQPCYCVGYITTSDGIIPSAKWNKNSQAIGHKTVPPSVITAIAEHYKDYLLENRKRTIKCHTITELSNGKRLVCQPNYCNGGDQYDWVVIKNDPNEGYDLFFENQRDRQNIPNNVREDDEDNMEDTYTTNKKAFIRPPHDVFQELGISKLFVASAGDETSKYVMDTKLFDEIRWTKLNSNITKNKLYDKESNVRTGIRHKKKFPVDYCVGDLPCVHHDIEKKSSIIQKYGANAVPAKVMALFVDPIDGKTKVLVHPCRTRRLEDMGQSTSIIEHWALQYKPRLEQKSNGVWVSDFDEWESLFAIVDLEQCHDDTLYVVQEFPGCIETISFNKKLAKACCIKLAIDNPSPFALTEKKRRIMHAARSVMVFRPFLEWGDVLWDEK